MPDLIQAVVNRGGAVCGYEVKEKWVSIDNIGDLEEESSQIDSNLPDLLIELNLKKAWEGIINAPSDTHFRQQFHRWFDAFKTLKLLKYYS